MTGTELREARRSKGLTQKQLAGLIGVRQPTIARWEGGENPIGGPEAIALRSILGNGKVPAKATKRSNRVN